MASLSDIEISLIIPAYNEVRRLPHSIQVMREHFAAPPWPSRMFEVLVIVEESTDGTLEAARETAAGLPNFHIVDNRVQRGKGYAVRCGIERARGAILFYMDADLSVPLEEIEVFLGHFEAHPEDDLLLGSRQHASSRVERRQSLVRQNMGKTFNHILRLLCRLPYRDTQCGFKAFRREAAQAIFARQRIDGFAFDVEILLLAQALGYRIRELPVRWLNSPGSKVKIVRDSLKMLRDAVVIRRRVGRRLAGGGQSNQ